MFVKWRKGIKTAYDLSFVLMVHVSHPLRYPGAALPRTLRKQEQPQVIGRPTMQPAQQAPIVAGMDILHQPRKAPRRFLHSLTCLAFTFVAESIPTRRQSATHHTPDRDGAFQQEERPQRRKEERSPDVSPCLGMSETVEC